MDDETVRLGCVLMSGAQLEIEVPSTATPALVREKVAQELRVLAQQVHLSAAGTPLQEKVPVLQGRDAGGVDSVEVTLGAVTIFECRDRYSPPAPDYVACREVGPVPPFPCETVDITDMGTDAEMVDFNLWLDDIKHRYKYGVYLVSGNHDWMWALNRVAEKKVPPEAVIHPKYLQNKVTSAKVLHHEMVEVAGLRIFGSDWCPWFGYAAPGDYWKMEWSDDRGLIYDRWKQQVLRSGKMAPVPTHRYDEIPEGVDILLSHMAPWNIFDHTLEGNWGSSQALLGRIQQTKPKAHLFGHIHEMRGGWERCNQSEAYRGGAEYEPLPGKIFAPQPAPPKEYPTDLILNNAQLNSLWVDHAYTGEWQPNSIAGPGKLIVARWSGGRWRFTAQAVPAVAPPLTVAKK